MSDAASDIGVIGAGSWGTALAIQLSRAGQSPALWGREPEVIDSLINTRCNSVFLPDIIVPEAVQITADLNELVQSHRDLLICVPSHVFRPILEVARPHMRDDARVAWATKGFEVSTGKLPHDVAEETLGTSVPLAVLSGPTFAREVGQGLPTAMTVASTDSKFAEDLAASLSAESFRTYTSSDVIGVEVGGAVKNVLAIATGMSDGLGFGANTRVALITRGLAELTRLGVALGGSPDTFMGLSGMGDLILTCTDDQSRNRRMGLGLAAGKSVEEMAQEIGQVVEGVKAAAAVHKVAGELGVEMPICEQAYKLLYEDGSPEDAVQALMRREVKSET
ncbi:MAG: NAD(P)H-dependent glycerol-3-phosphate dehydrogenase [Gammaproteobacteria bacterium]|jgi:glycerol-3-phosphate dehydrogenase (NAD(P)+)|nr:NAD(P)H-dependent glycerol-3-phosphate dehydrogenase [Gammaproteobacteria bacterium]MDP6616864.1 NAD(P)H-dependent glycerol-3-phosphate dehydrogenase [Gammaproteobacteria bacterium]MDP6694576.1 NAD(P)H-dependent glycerol-3-phosphate dehydrogenase [Gammaproteobacteria bacterium]